MICHSNEELVCPTWLDKLILAFCGSNFSTTPQEASECCLVHLVQHLHNIEIHLTCYMINNMFSPGQLLLKVLHKLSSSSLLSKHIQQSWPKLEGMFHHILIAYFWGIFDIALHIHFMLQDMHQKGFQKFDYSAI